MPLSGVQTIGIEWTTSTEEESEIAKKKTFLENIKKPFTSLKKRFQQSKFKDTMEQHFQLQMVR